MLRVKARSSEESCAAFLSFQLILTQLGGTIVHMHLRPDQAPRSMSSRPPAAGQIVLAESLRRIVADSNIEAAPRIAPEHVHKIRLAGNAAHKKEGPLRATLEWLRGLDLNQRPLGYEPNELPDCSTPHSHTINADTQGQTQQRATSPFPVRFRCVTQITLRRDHPHFLPRRRVLAWVQA